MLAVLVLMLANLFLTATASQAKEDKGSDTTSAASDSTSADKADKKAEKSAEKAEKDAAKAEKDAAKAAEKAEKDAEKAAEKAEKAAAKAEKDAAKAAEKGAKADTSAKADEKGAKADKSSTKCATYNVLYTDGQSDSGTFCGGNDVTRENTPGLKANGFHVSCSDDLSNPTKSDFGGLKVDTWRIETSSGKVCGSDSASTTTGTKGGKKDAPKDGTTKGDKCIDYVVMYTTGQVDQGSFCGGNNVTRENTPGLHAVSIHISCSDDLSNPTKSDLGGLKVDTWSIVKGSKTCGSPIPPTPPTPPTGYSAAAVPDCVTGGRVVLTNTGETTVTFTVVVDGSTIAQPTLLPGATSSLSVNVPEDGSVVVRVTVAGKTILDDTITRDCDGPPTPGDPAANAVFSCATAGTILLDNSTSATDRTFDVTIDGVTDSIDVAAGGVRIVNFDVAEDTTSTVTVAVGLVTLLDEEYAADCAGVLGVSLENDPLPAPLPIPDPAVMTPAPEVAPTGITSMPSTGADSGQLLVLGLLLLGVGVPVTFQSRPGRRLR